MAFLIGAIGLIWLILDDFYGKGRITTLANSIAEGAKLPTAGDVVDAVKDGVVDNVTKNGELIKDKVENIPGADAVINGGVKVITDPFETGKDAFDRWKDVLGVNGEEAKKKRMEQDRKELMDLIPDFKMPDLPKFGTLPALPALPSLPFGGK